MVKTEQRRALTAQSRDLWMMMALQLHALFQDIMNMNWVVDSLSLSLRISLDQQQVNSDRESCFYALVIWAETIR